MNTTINKQEKPCNIYIEYRDLTDDQAVDLLIRGYREWPGGEPYNFGLVKYFTHKDLYHEMEHLYGYLPYPITVYKTEAVHLD